MNQDTIIKPKNNLYMIYLPGICLSIMNQKEKSVKQ